MWSSYRYLVDLNFFNEFSLSVELYIVNGSDDIFVLGTMPVLRGTAGRPFPPLGPLKIVLGLGFSSIQLLKY